MTWNADPLEVQEGAAADGESRMILKRHHRIPERLDGQQAIRDFSHRAAASPLRIDDLQTVAVHHTSDPEVVIVELLSRVTFATTGRRLAVRSIQVFRIRDGKILLFRDYFNPNGLADALGS